MTVLNLRWLAALTAVYLFLLPTNHGTYLRSIAFGGSILFTVFALGWSLRERGERPEARIPMPPWSIVLTVAAWFAWSAASYFWSVKPRYTSGQLAREVAENALLVVAFYVACFDIVLLRRYAATVLAGFVIMAALAIGYAMSPAGLGSGAQAQRRRSLLDLRCTRRAVVPHADCTHTRRVAAAQSGARAGRSRCWRCSSRRPA